MLGRRSFHAPAASRTPRAKSVLALLEERVHTFKAVHRDTPDYHRLTSEDIAALATDLEDAGRLEDAQDVRERSMLGVTDLVIRDSADDRVRRSLGQLASEDIAPKAAHR